MRGAIIGLLLFFVCEAAHAKEAVRVVAEASEGQAARWIDGFETIKDTKPLSDAIFGNRSLELPGKPTTFVVVVANNSGAAVTFGPEDVQIELASGETIGALDAESVEGQLRRDI